MLFIKIMLLTIATLLFVLSKGLKRQTLGFVLINILFAWQWMEIQLEIFAFVIIISLLFWIITLIATYFSTYEAVQLKSLKIKRPLVQAVIGLLGGVLVMGVELYVILNYEKLLRVEKTVGVDYFSHINLQEEHVTYFLLMLLLVLGVAIFITMTRQMKRKGQ